ncbi:MAG: RsmD family RNA methyltransferase [Chloroflexota bacterium]
MTVRVTAGTARGRQLFVPKTDLRPTTDKIKQAIFSMLEAEALRRGYEGSEDSFAACLAWPTVLDLYSGSGSLGIEALSRGAAQVTFIERDRAAAQTIERNLDKTELRERGTVRRASVEAGLAALSGTYDLILLDPPYKETAAALRTLMLITTHELLADRGLIVWEHQAAKVALALPEGLRSVRRRDHGVTSVTILERELSEQLGEHDRSD